MIYFARVGDDGPIKIGKTVDLPTRLKTHARERRYGGSLTVIGVMEGGRDTEKEVHRRFAHLRTNARNHRTMGPVELFHPGEDLMAFIARECREPDLLDTLHEGTGRRARYGPKVTLAPFRLSAYVKSLVEQDLASRKKGGRS